MSCIHYKFKSSLDYDTITFEDLQVSLKELRDAICKAKKIGQSNDHKLEIVNAQTKKKYEDEQEMIPRNTSVIVQRVPTATKQNASRKQKLQIFPQSESSKLLSAEEMVQNKMTDLATANATEEEKLKAMMSQSSEGFDPSKYPSKPISNKQGVRMPPPSYVCFRCGQRGHWLKFCPTQGDTRYDSLAVKPLAGVPSSQLVTLDHHVPGAMIDRHGNYVMRSVDYCHGEVIYCFGCHSEAMLKKSKPSAPVKVQSIPDELKCSMCSELMKDAVIIQCCGESFCDECIRDYLLENDFTCPKCSETDVSPDTLMANKALRTAVKNHQNVNNEQRIVPHKGLDNVTRHTTIAPPAVEKINKKQNSVTTTTLSYVAMKTSASNVTMTTASNVTNFTTVAPSTSVTMTTASNKKAALHLVSQLEKNILIKQAASSAAQEVITSDALTVAEPSATSHDSASVAHMSKSVSPKPQQTAAHSDNTVRQSSITVQPIITQPTTSSATTITYSTNTAPAFKPALLPTPAASATTAATPAAPVAPSQLDPLAVAAAALLLASGTNAAGNSSSTTNTAPDPASLLAADQLLQQELNNRSRSPAPLSAEEFYRQQNRLKSKNKRKHSSSASSSPVRVHKRKHHHHHHHSNKSERKKHKEHSRPREQKSSSHKQKRKKHHKEHLPDLPSDEGNTADVEFKMPHTRSAVTVVKRPTDPKVSLIAPDLESPVLPACVQNFTEPAELLATCGDQNMVNKDQEMVSKDQVIIKESTSASRATDVRVATVQTTAATSSESVEEDGIEEGEILEGSGTHTPTGSDPSVKDVKVIRKLKRKLSQSIEPSTEKQSSHKLKKRKWKKEKDIGGEKTKKHKLRS